MKKLLVLSIAFIVVSAIFGTIEVVGQQILRQDANDPQIQMAQDAATALNSGASPTSLVSGKIDPSTSLAPFIIIYDDSGQVAASNGSINGHTPTMPSGSLTASKGRDYHVVTWQPQSDVRIAAVNVAANHYIVVAGRSLKEVERREGHILQLVVVGWVASVLIIVLGMTVYRRLGQMNVKRKS